MPEPVFDSGGTDTGIWSAPQNPQASQGDKRSVTLSWDPVKGAVQYRIYRADDPTNETVLYRETAGAATEYVFSGAAPGADYYYQVKAVSSSGEESPLSRRVRGTTLAQPVISDIVMTEEDGGNKAQVYWDMANASPETYKNQLLFTVYCFDGETEYANVNVDGSQEESPSAVFFGLSSNTNYTFQVEAYLRGDQSKTEVSTRVDEKTARLQRPQPAQNLRASMGASTSSVILSFQLPDMVEVPITENIHELHPLYFVVSRREKDSDKAFQVICPYIGSNAATAASKGSSGVFFSNYESGKTISWNDSSILSSNRGINYEYRVQSYADDVNRVITSSQSLAESTGWAMKNPELAILPPVYTFDKDGASYKKAELPLAFSHENQSVPYRYVLRETISPVGDGEANDPAWPLVKEYELNYDELLGYKTDIDLTRPTTENSRGRGLYSYSLDVVLNDTKVETVHAVGDRRVTEITEPVEVEKFSVKDGYPDKYTVSWKRNANRKYVLRRSPAENGPWTDVETFPSGYAEDGQLYSCEVPAASGTSCYFAIYAINEAGRQGESVYSRKVMTMGTPAPAAGVKASYDTINLSWNPVQMADAYRIRYQYAGGGNEEMLNISASTLAPDDITGEYSFSFRPKNYNDAAWAGKTISFQLEALNKGRQASDGGGEIKTASALLDAKLVGPAELSPATGPGLSGSQISIGWNAVEGAGGYYIIRRQFDLRGGQTPVSGNEILYYVDSRTNSLKGKGIVAINMIKEDSTALPSTLQYDAPSRRYNFADIYLDDKSYASYQARKYVPSYIDEQNEIAWGFPYKYYIIPVISEDDVPFFSYAGTATTYNLNGVTYRNVAGFEQTGHTLGFAGNVEATKGTYGKHINEELINTGVKVTWDKPAPLSSVSPFYFVYRKTQADPQASWELLTDKGLSAAEFIDDAEAGSFPEEGTAYEYLVGLGLSPDSPLSRPDENARFMKYCRDLKDDVFPGESAFTGFVLAKPRLISASREEYGSENTGYYEIISWNAAGIDCKTGEVQNRGISGYEVQILNRNIDSSWHTILDISAADLGKTKTPESHVDNSSGWLKVLRDYKHYFRIRSYTLDGDARVYSAAPDYGAADGEENDYVKWGARQITAREFAAITSLSLGTAIDKENGVSISESNIGYNREIRFTSAQPFFMAVSGSLHGYCTATLRTPRAYGAVCKGILGSISGGKDKESILTLTGPTGFPFYSGSVRITSLYKGGGTFVVSYNGADTSIENKDVSAPFTFDNRDNAYNYKNCDSLDWNDATGWN